MKKYLTALLALYVLESFAAYTGPVEAEPVDLAVSYPNSIRSRYSAGAGAFWGNQFNDANPLEGNSYQGSWAFEKGFQNETIGSGRAELAIRLIVDPDTGQATTEGATVYYHHNVSGYIAALFNNTGYGETVNAILDDDVTITSSERSIFIADRHRNNNNMGTWNVSGGNFKAGDNVVHARTITSLNIDSTSMEGGNSGSSAVIVRSGTINVSNSRGRTDMVIKAGRTSGEVAGAGVYTASSANISGDYITLSGSEGTQSGRISSLDDNLRNQRANISGGSGAYIEGAATVNGGNLRFLAGGGGGRIYADAAGDNAVATSVGGYGAYFGSGGGTISNSLFKATSGGQAEIATARYLIASETYTNTAINAKAYAHGGSGLRTGTGTRTLIDTEAYGGSGGSARAIFQDNYADATGGNGIYTLGGLVINGGKYVGGAGGSALAEKGEAYAFGGSGIYARGTSTIEINGGTFEAGRGGTENGKKAADGAGVRTEGGTLDINGGTFNGIINNANGDIFGNAIWVSDTDLNISEDVTDTYVNGNIYIEDNAGKTVSITGGSINGDIIKAGTGTTGLSISNAASYTGSFIQREGTVAVTIGNVSEGEFFSDVTVFDGDISFGGTTNLVTKENSVFTLGSTNTTLTFSQGAELSKGTKIQAGLSDIASSGGALVMRENSSISLFYDGLSGELGSLDITGSSFTMDDNAMLMLQGIASTPTNSIAFISGGSVAVSSNAVVDADLGWLVDETVNIGTSDITVDTVYNSLTNTTLNDIDANVLAYLDNLFQSTNVNFYDLNAQGEEDGDKMVRYGVSQMPDSSEAAFQVSQQLNEQLAARGTEFRSMNGFASTKPNFKTGPAGVAGPQNGIEEEKTMQGWVRFYGGKGSRDKSGNFAEYDTTAWGSVIGVDKSFGNLLIGLAGGYAHTDLDADASYQAKINTYHGSLYSTFGGESLFIDMALTLGWTTTEEESNLLTQEGEFDSQLYSLYLGAGYAFDLGEKLSLTPEASLLASFYDQEEYDRSIVGGALGTVGAYDTSSYLGSLGVNLATQHQIDWLNRGIAYIPEVRAHYIHEFNADPDDFNYTIGGNPGVFAVRPRDESLFRLGIGFDLWSWKVQSAKFEIDYDALLSDTYREHIVSGKATFRF